MNCPNCGNEIKENQKFCTYCGAKKSNNIVYKEKVISFLRNKKVKNICIISSIILVLLISCSLAYQPVYQYLRGDIQVELPNYEQVNNDYKSINAIDYEQIENMSPKEMTDKLIQQEIDLKEYFKQNHSKEERNAAFTIFYENLDTCIKKINSLIDNNDIELNNTIQNLSFTTTADLGEITHLEPNYNYLYTNYAKYLSKPYADYLNVKNKEQISREGFSLWFDGKRNLGISKKTLVNYIVTLRNLINSNPDFELWYNVISDIKIYTDALICIGNYDPETIEDLQKLYKQLLIKIKPKNNEQSAYEYDVIEQFYAILGTDKYDTEYRSWYDMTFYDGEPIITQGDMNNHEAVLMEMEEKAVKSKIQSFKDLKLDDNGKLSNYIKNYEKRKEAMINLVFPEENRMFAYGSSYPLQLSGVISNFNDLELFTYQKIADTYQNKYEHVNIIRAKGYSDYYEQTKSRILSSENFGNEMKQYIANYETRKNMFKAVVSDKMNDTDFSIWFIKLELYTYKILLYDFSGLEDMSEEINEIFTK